MEVRPTSTNQGHGLYTTKAYQLGEIILEESTLFTFAPNTDEQISKIRSEFHGLSAKVNNNSNNDDLSKKARKYSNKVSKITVKNNKQSSKPSQQTRCCLFDIALPSTIESSKERGKFRGMLIAAACYALFCNDNDIKVKLQKLYFPHTNTINEEEKLAINTAKQALKFLQNATKPSQALHAFSSKHSVECQTIMLIWAFNTFEGGVIYETMSRVNHSCDFNCILIPPDEEDGTTKQVIRAACDIEDNVELTSSYLGTFTYACRSTRIRRLFTDKYFTCECSRCCNEKENDFAASIPCLKCHPRAGRYLDEDTQYDDGDSEVTYVCPGYNNIDGGQKIQYVCKLSKDKTILDKNSELFRVMEKVVERVESLLSQDLCLGKKKIKNDGSDEDLEMLERLSSLSSSVLGSRHWCTNIMLAKMLGKNLTSIHSSMLLNSTGKGSESLDMTEVAECVDSLQRVWKFVEGLEMKSHPGHLLGSLTIGVARILVGLGDEKSMQYGAEWAEKVGNDYYQKGFEGEGMKKVVETLMKTCNRKEKVGARKRMEEEGTEEKKRAKLS